MIRAKTLVVANALLQPIAQVTDLAAPLHFHKMP